MSRLKRWWRRKRDWVFGPYDDDNPYMKDSSW